MTVQPLTRTVQVPERFFTRLQNIARQTHRSVEDVLVTSVNAVLPPEMVLPAELESELAAMTLFKDDQLWASTKSSLSAVQQLRLEQLTGISDQRSLTTAEETELQELLDEYDHALLRRARALVILAQRGYDLPEKAEAAGNDEDI